MPSKPPLYRCRSCLMRAEAGPVYGDGGTGDRETGDGGEGGHVTSLFRHGDRDGMYRGRARFSQRGKEGIGGRGRVLGLQSDLDDLIYIRNYEERPPGQASENLKWSGTGTPAGHHRRRAPRGTPLRELAIHRLCPAPPRHCFSCYLAVMTIDCIYPTHTCREAPRTHAFCASVSSP